MYLFNGNGVLYVWVPTESWSVVNLDFIEGLPKSHNKSVILVVIDKFSKYAHFLPLSHPFTALQVAQLYFNNVYKLHGLPILQQRL